ncbi:MAG: LPS export ABC transporter periplasmic protein LptC, partial [Gammaproteobacteria bacterium]|nr:LPS export ABC transporter periplasmic protein LptC [Gammaproteobacteria bacterium]
ADGVLVLSGEVVLHQTDPERGFTTVRTAELRVHPDPRYAETERDVMIETEAGRTFAQGLKADLERRILNLQADADGPVHTIVLPEQIGQ